MSDLKKEFQYYLDNKTELIKKHDGKFIVIKNLQVIGVYDDRMVAIEETKKTHALGSFLVQHVTSTNEDQVRFHSRVG